MADHSETLEQSVTNQGAELRRLVTTYNIDPAARAEKAADNIVRAYGVAEVSTMFDCATKRPVCRDAVKARLIALATA